LVYDDDACGPADIQFDAQDDSSAARHAHDSGHSAMVG